MKKSKEMKIYLLFLFTIFFVSVIFSLRYLFHIIPESAVTIILFLALPIILWVRKKVVISEDNIPKSLTIGVFILSGIILCCAIYIIFWI
ncbi:hypothetical protein P7H71_01020 [Lactococcus lactis]|uniref:Uncharacterized protein n=1 Tax=Lactococcus lactis TaxID=1358 RepID=A0AAP5P9Z0_9LACT|nr:hypothetical protein [Lactococcus lactis]MDT2860061.1 hypothetical protein [Lactococcus lactis]MDT2862361.1 hypothetical protein [Lactococcus lactis]MDT2867983.1 hypothetical protein [Lactococcus lactis]MDT2869435.1 hypothetical protein [Lactococcus lactis]MDT2873031.1 hypothetical protein [Lactococcus lactis]